MSEKRFTLEQWTKDILYFSDGEYSAHMSIGYICKKVEKKLNEQQAIITEQEEHIELLTKTIERMIKKINKIYKLSASERSV